METDRAFELLKVIEEEVGFEASLDMRMEDLGLDSLEFYDLMVTLGSKIGPIPEIEWGRFDTVGDIARFFEDQLSSRAVD